MGREVKRVDFDFEWFENNKNERGNAKTWFGYVLDSIPCPCCEFGKNSKGNYCPICEGESEVYPCIEVPKGDGWQMWENVSEGSPISPVFKTPEELAKWLVDNSASSMGSQTATYEQWMSTIKMGFAPSMVMTNGKLISGVEAMEDLQKNKQNRK